MWVNLKFHLNYSSNGITIFSSIYQNRWPVFFLYFGAGCFPLLLISIIPILLSEWEKVPCLNSNLRKTHLKIICKRDDKRISHKPCLIYCFLIVPDWAMGRRWLLICLKCAKAFNSCFCPPKSSKKEKENINIYPNT